MRAWAPLPVLAPADPNWVRAQPAPPLPSPLCPAPEPPNARQVGELRTARDDLAADVARLEAAATGLREQLTERDMRWGARARRRRGCSAL